MKKIFVLILGQLIIFQAYSQLKTTKLCPAFSVDILAGKVNGVEPDFTQGQIKSALPCFTQSEEENVSSKCGGLISYRDKDIYFYTGRDYVEIGPAYKGKLSLPLMGASRNAMFKWFGNPAIKDVKWDAYTTQYGILILYFNSANKVNKIQFSTQSSATINLCE